MNPEKAVQRIAGRVGLRGLGAVLVWIFLLAAPGGAYAQEEGGRAERWRERRIARAARLEPPRRGKVEGGLFQFEDRRIMEAFRQGYRGFHPRLGGLVTGSGFALGTEYRSDGLELRDILFRVSGQASFKGYQLYEFQLGRTGERDQRLVLDFTARYFNFPQEDFFGLGSGSSEATEANFRHEQTDMTGTIGVRPLPWLSVGTEIGYIGTNTGRGTDDEPSVEDLFDDTTAPGLFRQPDYFRVGAFLDIDYRDSQLNARRGGLYRLSWSTYDDRDPREFSFERVEAEVRQYVPFWNLRRVIAFRARASLAGTSAEERVPFFMQPTLGGSEDLRGFEEFRFRDRNLFVMNLEYRWEAFSGLDMAIFGDAGKVFARRADFDFTDLEAAYGFGARFNSANGVFFRIDTGFSNEGTRVFFKFGHAF